MGGDSEKLLTLEEAARRLNRSADDLESLIRSGKLPSFRLGGNLLRIRAVDVEALQPGSGQVFRRPAGGDGLSRILRAPRPARSSPWDRVRDFFYFNSFYLVALLILLTLLAVILTL